ncbi:unnamed protein product [Blepharisma stoltei]|uniref:TLC domain-containing protein n=1 Tax=Blepharisma stoltei TaxID=1481888 RepID=A0AAU9J1X2_9CILI|nr:unnamed protein product [Blepharisma stoltei]
MSNMTFHDDIWFSWSSVAWVPMFWCTFYRIWCEKQSTFVKEAALKTDTVDTIFRILLWPSAIYYIADSINLMFFAEAIDQCKISFFVHHVVTLVGAGSALTIPHYPWFLMLPFAFHCFLMMFPLIGWLNYIYLATVFRNAYGLHQAPYIEIAKYRHILYVVYLLLVPLIMLWGFGCSNERELS